MPTVLFNLSFTGSGSVGSESWINLGTIPTSYKWWIGSSSYTAVSKLTSFDLRSNTAGQSAGTLGATTSKDLASVKTNVTVNHDLYKNGSLHVSTVVGTGVEKLWLRVYSKSGTAGNYLYKVNYTLE